MATTSTISPQIEDISVPRSTPSLKNQKTIPLASGSFSYIPDSACDHISQVLAQPSPSESSRNNVTNTPDNILSGSKKASIVTRPLDNNKKTPKPQASFTTAHAESTLR